MQKMDNLMDFRDQTGEFTRGLTTHAESAVAMDARPQKTMTSLTIG